MTAPSPGHWSDMLWKTTVTVVLVAVGIRLAWWLVQPVLPYLIMILVLVFIIRVALGMHHARRGW